MSLAECDHCGGQLSASVQMSYARDVERRNDVATGASISRPLSAATTAAPATPAAAAAATARSEGHRIRLDQVMQLGAIEKRLDMALSAPAVGMCPRNER